MQNKFLKSHPISMLSGDNFSGILNHPQTFRTVQTGWLAIIFLLWGLDVLHPLLWTLFLKEIRMCVQEGICSALCERFCLAWGVRTVKHEHSFSLVWTPISPVLLLPPFSLVHLATNRNDLALVKNEKHVSYDSVLLQEIISFVYN